MGNIYIYIYTSIIAASTVYDNIYQLSRQGTEITEDDIVW